MSGDIHLGGDENFQWVAENMPDLIILTDLDGHIQYISRTLEGFDKKDVIGTHVTNWIPENGHAAMNATIARVKETRTEEHFRMPSVSPDGGTVDWENRIAPARRDGEMVGFIIISSNVTERRRADLDRERFFTLTTDLLCVAGFDGRFKRLNPAFERLLGFSEAELLAMPILDIVGPEDRDRAAEQLARLAKGEAVAGFEVDVRTKEGGTRLVSWHAVSEPDLGIIHANGRDITTERAMHHELRQTQKMDAIGKLAGGVAHDFNNLVLAILMNTDLCLENATDPATQAALKEIKNAGHRAAELNRQLLSFSRRQPIAMESLDLVELTRNMMDMLRRLIPTSVEIDFIPGHGMPNVRGDASQLDQVVLNLCINARDAMPDGGRLTVELETVLVNGTYRETHPWAKPGRYVLLTVTDTGHGMSKEVQDRALEPFFTTKATGEGTGLGLSTAYGIVKKHEGMMNIYSEVGRGTTFKIYLPAVERSAGVVGSKIEERVRGGHEKILVAEDTDIVGRIVKTILEKAGYQVVMAANGVEALAAADANPDVRLALLDIVMPKLGGPEAGKLLKERRPDLQILYTSGYSERAALELGGVDPETVINKPYVPDTLLVRIRQALDGA